MLGKKTGGRKKIIGKCKAEGCERELDSLGLCRMHYTRFRSHGVLHKVNRLGKSTHALRSTWGERHGRGSLCPEWNDFWQFVKDVGERPSKNHYMVKIDRSKLYDKDNFKWIEHIRRQPNESKLSWRKRKWQQRLKLNPSLKEYGRGSRELGISLIEYSRLYLEKLSRQNNLCAICFQPETMRNNKTKKTIRLAFDHCHKTKKIRDLLCTRCNKGIGLLQDCPNLVEKLTAYLKTTTKNPSGIAYNHRSKIDYLHVTSVAQNNLCGSCGQSETILYKSKKYKRLSVDHCHTTMQIRGLLCNRCNTAIGMAKDSITILESMAEYLKRHST